jgi:transcriptional regulator NrdR family protein
MKRRRICLAGHRFTTHEVMADQSPIGAARDAIEKIRNHLKSIRELLADIESEDHGES